MYICKDTLFMCHALIRKNIAQLWSDWCIKVLPRDCNHPYGLCQMKGIALHDDLSSRGQDLLIVLAK